MLGLDVGSRRIGVAISDLLGITAQGLATIQRRNKRTDLAALEKVIREHDVSEIVVGLPLRMSGVDVAEVSRSEHDRSVVQKLGRRTGLTFGREPDSFRITRLHQVR